MKNSNFLNESFKNKKVVVTGHTGFKGSWLSIWLHSLGADVFGISSDIPSIPSHFMETNVGAIIKDYRLDINDSEKLKNLFLEIKPDFVFHLAAQPLVRKSFQEPLLTWHTNTIGTLNVLESIRCLVNNCVAILITSDKSYENVEWTWGYRENDRLGGLDPYSSSKACAELIIKSFYDSFLKNKKNLRIGIGRAGNVIGGGDWAEDRLVPDCMKSWHMDKTVNIRNPVATRPWQHVLEPLSGYLNLALNLSKSNHNNGEPFNFGPPSQQNHSVLEVVMEMSNYWDKVKWEINCEATNIKECGLLKLNCDKALSSLGWLSVWNFKETIYETVTWYKTFYESKNNINNNSTYELTLEQIKRYTSKAQKLKLKWSL